MARPTAAKTPAAIPFYSSRQAGIATPLQRQLRFIAFDVDSTDAADLSSLLRAWTDLAGTLAAGRAVANDTGEAAELGAARLTITFGFGPSLFLRDGEDRFGIATQQPRALAPLPAFVGDALERDRSGGDVGVQICADDPQVAFHAMHQLIREAHGIAHPRWAQAGFSSLSESHATPRNSLGFKDGTRNVDVRSEAAMAANVWCADGPPWMRGGTYAVVRRVRTLLDTWDGLDDAAQERIVGRHKASGAPLGGRREHDTPDFAAQGPEGPIIASDAHVRLAASEHNGGRTLLRRSYSYDDGIDLHTGQLDAGLVFIAYQRDPRTQFVPLQRRLAENDALSEHLLHTGSAVFACPPGVRKGGTIGQGLLG